MYVFRMALAEMAHCTIFVGNVNVNLDGLNVDVNRFEYDNQWNAENAHRLVTQQLNFSPSVLFLWEFLFQVPFSSYQAFYRSHRGVWIGLYIFQTIEFWGHLRKSGCLEILKIVMVLNLALILILECCHMGMGGSYKIRETLHKIVSGIVRYKKLIYLREIVNLLGN